MNEIPALKYPFPTLTGNFRLLYETTRIPARIPRELVQITDRKQTASKMAGYGPPPGPYGGFQASGGQPIGFEMHQQGYPPYDSRPGYPPPPPQDIYHPATNDYNNFANPVTPSGPSYHHHGDENGDNLPPVGFEGIGSQKDQDTATTSGVKLVDRESPVPPISSQPSRGGSHQMLVKPQVQVRFVTTCKLAWISFSKNAVLFDVNLIFCFMLFSFVFVVASEAFEVCFWENILCRKVVTIRHVRTTAVMHASRHLSYNIRR